MDFIFKHLKTGKLESVSLSENEIQKYLEDYLYEKLGDCECKPIGETTFVECNCEDYLSEFELQERT